MFNRLVLLYLAAAFVGCGQQSSPPPPAAGPAAGSPPRKSQETQLQFKTLDDWLKDIKDKNEAVRVRAADALGKEGPKTNEVIPALIAALKDPSEQVLI